MAIKPRYMTPRTAKFFNSITNEYVNSVKGQFVYIHPILPEQSGDVESNKYQKIYGESSTLKYGEAIQIPCTVSISPKRVENFEDTFQESMTELEFFIYRELLKSQNINFVPNLGDVVVFQRLFFEIHNIDDTEMHMGSPEYKFGFNCQAHRKRVSNLDIPFKEDYDI